MSKNVQTASRLGIDVHAHHVPRGLLSVDRRFQVWTDAKWGEVLHF